MDVKLGEKSSRAIDLLKRVQGDVKVVPVESAPVVEPPKVVEAKPAAPEAPASKDEPYDFGTPIPPEKPAAEPSKSVLPEDLDPADEVDGLIDPKGTTGENFKKLRTKLKAVTKEHKEHLSELETLRQKVKDYDSGQIVPEITQAQMQRIAELEKYEKLYNLKASPVYQEKVVKPIEKEKEKIKEFISGYSGVTEDIVNQAFAAPPAEQNKILMNAFKDEVGVLEIKSLFNNIRKIQTEGAELEKEPAQALARLEADNARILQEKRQRANEAIHFSSKQGWSNSLGDLRSDARFKEINFVEGDTEHNEKYVRPILTKASQAFGQTTRMLAEHGLTELPTELAQKLAKSDILAMYSAALLTERDALRARVAELEKLTSERERRLRPGLNRSGGSVTPSSTGAVGAANAGRRVLDRVSNGKVQ